MDQEKIEKNPKPKAVKSNRLLVLNLYLISQVENNNYDTYNAAIVAAESAAEAKKINPSDDWNDRWSGWCSSPKKVSAKLIGLANVRVKKGVILGSFNAG